MAHKKGQGSTKNGRDSNPQYRGVKLYGGERATAGSASSQPTTAYSPATGTKPLRTSLRRVHRRPSLVMSMKSTAMS